MNFEGVVYFIFLIAFQNAGFVGKIPCGPEVRALGFHHREYGFKA